MCNLAGLRLLQETGRCCHPNNARYMSLRNTSQIRDVFDGNAAAEGDAGEELEFSQPLEACEQLVLDGEMMEEIRGAGE